ncbi:MAG: Holliday junction branch migration protein RuvA [Pseudomonadota bacterium]
MIGFLRGTLVYKQPPLLLLDVGGVGYEVNAPMTTFYELGNAGSELTLFTHLAVSDSAHTLYGFSSRSERRLFRALIKVSGVGPRLGLTILSGISVDGFARCVQFEDTATLVKLPGIGKKTAERLVIEMRDKLDDDFTAADPGPGEPQTDGQTDGNSRQAEGEAYGALIALGYKPAEVSRMLKNVETDGLSTEDIIRTVLKAAS